MERKKVGSHSVGMSQINRKQDLRILIQSFALLYSSSSLESIDSNCSPKYSCTLKSPTKRVRPCVLQHGNALHTFALHEFLHQEVVRSKAVSGIP